MLMGLSQNVLECLFRRLGNSAKIKQKALLSDTTDKNCMECSGLQCKYYNCSRFPNIDKSSRFNDNK